MQRGCVGTPASLLGLSHRVPGVPPAQPGARASVLQLPSLVHGPLLGGLTSRYINSTPCALTYCVGACIYRLSLIARLLRVCTIKAPGITPPAAVPTIHTAANCAIKSIIAPRCGTKLHVTFRCGERSE